MIRVESVSMKWFRGIREGTIDGLADVNVLVGRNNCGKTTVVEAILRVAATMTGGHQDLLVRNRDGLITEARNEQELVVPELWYKSDQSQTIEVELVLCAGPNSKGICLHTVKGSDRVFNAIGTYREEGLQQPKTTEFLNNISLFRSQDARDRNIENSVWPKLLASRKDKALRRALNDVFDLQADNFSLLPDQTLMVLFEDHGVPLDSQGDGTRAAVRALAILSMLKGTLLLIEEPECHQHPASLERFARVLCKQASEQQVQLILSTHSIECVRALLKGAEEAKSEAAVIHLTLDEGKLESRRLDAEAVEALQATGIDVRALNLYA